MTGATTALGLALSIIIVHHVGLVKARTTISSAQFDKANLRQKDVCGDWFISPNGTLSSPGYPINYTNNLDCFWIIQVPENNTISMEFTFMEIEYHRLCIYDALIVRDGDLMTSPKLRGRMCGTVRPNSGPHLETTGNQAFIHFRTDYINVYRGFKLHWSAVPIEQCPTHPLCPPASETCAPCPKVTCPPVTCPNVTCPDRRNNLDIYKPKQRSHNSTSERSGCGERFTNTTGSFHSPGYPNQYTNNLDCFWSITTTVGHKINLKFTDLEVEYHRLCRYDTITIRDGARPTSPILGHEICGGLNPYRGLKMTSTGNEVFIHFQTDYINVRKGFMLEWTSESISKCPPPPPCRAILCFCPPCSTEDDCSAPVECPKGSTTGTLTNDETDDVIFTFVNRCTQDLWMGAQGISNTRPSFVYNGLNFFVPNNGGWHLSAGATSQISVPFDFSAGRFWARTGCTGTINADFHCETGDCGPWIECATGNVPRGGAPPATLAEFTLNANNQDYFDISLVDGFNLPMTIHVVTYDDSKVNPDEYWCNSPECLFDINSICPHVLAVNGTSGIVACDSACTKFDTDEYCCRKPCCGTPETCTPDKWQVDYPHEIYKAHCPQAYSYAYDDKTSTFFCSNTNYDIFFC